MDKVSTRQKEMNLSQSYFVYGGPGSFQVFSNQPTKSRLHDVIRLPFGTGISEVYQIEPARSSQWVVVVELRKMFCYTRQADGEFQLTIDPATVALFKERIAKASMCLKR